MRRSRTRRAAAAAVRLLMAVMLLAAVPAPTAGADWLVLTDGSRVETRGAWEEKGRLVVFHTADGTLASLRVAEVDLAASREATAEAQRPPAEEPPAEAPAERRAARRITNADIPAGSPAPARGPAAGGATREDAGEAAGNGAGNPAARAADRRPGAGSPVEVGTWERVNPPGESLAFRGTLRNTSDRVTAAAVKVRVEVTAHDGGPLGTRAAAVRPSTLPAGASGTFEVSFDDLYAYGTVRFEVDSVSLRQGGEEPAGGEAPPEVERDGDGSD